MGRLSGLAEEDFAVADGEGDFGEGGDVVGGEGGAQRKKAGDVPGRNRDANKAKVAATRKAKDTG